MSQTDRAPSRIRPSGAVILLFLLAVVLLVTDHWARAFGVLPYLLLLACPLMHLLHGRHHGTGHGPAARVHGHDGQPPADGPVR